MYGLADDCGLQKSACARIMIVNREFTALTSELGIMAQNLEHEPFLLRISGLSLWLSTKFRKYSSHIYHLLDHRGQLELML